MQAGDWLRIAPDGKRQISAASDSPIGFICIQVKAGSLEGYTMTDGVVQLKIVDKTGKMRGCVHDEES